jgi:hypothetical protein
MASVTTVYVNGTSVVGTFSTVDACTTRNEARSAARIGLSLTEPPPERLPAPSRSRLYRGLPG